MILMGALTVITLKEDYKPDLQELKKKEDKSKDKDQSNFSFLLTRVWKTIKSDPKYSFSFLGAGAINIVLLLYGTYLIMWITSFVESG